MATTTTEKPKGGGRPPKPSSAPALSTRETLRWAWRQLTSMRTALFLLLLLAVAAIPGSLVPQRGVDAQALERYQIQHPDLAPVLDRLGFFSVYTSPWFSAVYLLLMVSLVGCILPRTLVYLRALRARPPKAPRNLERLPESRRYETDAAEDEVVAHARKVLGRGRARVDVVGSEVRAESGYLREAGNLVFHVCLVVVLVSVAAGGLLGYRGSAIVVDEGGGFSNDLTQYDEFSAGALFDTDTLPPFSLTLDDFRARFQLSGPQRGAPREFEALGRYTERPGAAEKPFDIQVNHPLDIDGTSVFIVGQGYAPVIKVTDGDGKVAFDGAVPFLPEDGTYTSTGVVKVPDAGPEQLGFQGFFLPTAISVGDDAAPISAFPGAANPNLGLFAYYGDLGLDDGDPQSVFILDKDDLTQMTNADGTPFRINLSQGQVTDLPDGRGSVEFVGLRQFVKFQFSSSPGLQIPLWATSIGVLGLIMSLSIRPRRTWLRTRREGTRTVVEVAGLDRVSRGDLGADLDEVLRELQEKHPPSVDEPDPDDAEPDAHAETDKSIDDQHEDARP
ncbi:cytochrome c biogenesis protein ResB [Solicola sp. PLA-1-18]|uniref:cytochrome c biogenesis protein ResB n=1 Tax=Solicola sp. PLA-1-18 TaxID=3380532 RepID=UPI003B7F6B69